MKPNSPDSIAVLQSEIRKKVLEKLRAVSPERKKSASLNICQRAQSEVLSALRSKALNDSTIALYRPLPEDVDLACLIKFLESEKVRTVFPRIFGSTMEMAQSCVSQPEDWKVGAFKVLEPNASCPKVAPNEIDLVLVPGIAFSQDGSRIGRGKGFYDRYLTEVKCATRLALLYDEQWVGQSLPEQPWDQKMDICISESRLLRWDRPPK